MGYSIFYDKQFVKLESTGTFIPMVLAGSSNCYEWSPGGRERRERSWFSFNHVAKNFHATEEEMLAEMAEERQRYIDRNKKTLEENPNWDVYDDKSFGYFSALAINGSTRNTTYGQYMGIVKTGCKKALTIEQLREENIFLQFRTLAYGDETKKQHKEFFGTESSKYVTVNTEEEFLNQLGILTEIVKGTDISLHLELTGMYESTTKRLRRTYFPTNRNKKVLDTSKGRYVIMIDNQHFRKFTRNRMYRSVFGGWYHTDENTAKRKFNHVYNKLRLYSVSNVELIWIDADGSKTIIESRKVEELVK